MSSDIPAWCVFRGDRLEQDPLSAPLESRLETLPSPPPWRDFSGDTAAERGRHFKPDPEDIQRVNAALFLRRPLLITGKPGVGKTSLAYAVAHELGLGSVLRWSITSRSTLQDGLYRYDAVGRLQAIQEADKKNKADPGIGEFITLGPLGTAFYGIAHTVSEGPRKGEQVYYPRVLLIDEIDKSDIDLPNDLLHVFEEGHFEIPELVRVKRDSALVTVGGWGRGNPRVAVENGEVPCKAFPLVIMTSNGEREFPAAFLRRCLRLEMQPPRNLPDDPKVDRIVDAHLGLDKNHAERREIEALIAKFLECRDGGQPKDLAMDQLFNAIYLAINRVDVHGGVMPQNKESLLDTLWRSLSEG